MKINHLVIENFKSIERIELVEPNPFTVFVGPNGSGKSNIFEALEFVILGQLFTNVNTLKSLFGGETNFVRRQAQENNDVVKISVETSDGQIEIDTGLTQARTNKKAASAFLFTLLSNHTRLFVGKDSIIKLNFTDNDRLSSSASNMETVLKRLLTYDEVKSEIYDWLSLFIPGFRDVEVISGSLDGKDTLLIYEQGLDKPFTKELISDGTYNILALLTAVYQSDDEPQFLCIEEPENGLHPQVIAEFVNLCRYACEEFGHFIWLNTHSESLVRKLKTEDIVLVDKRDGATQIKRVKDMNLHDLPMDEAWLSNALGGGTPW